MLVKDFMTKVVETLTEEQNLLEARALMRGKNLQSIPVVDEMQRIRGIITAEDVNKVSPSDASTLSRHEANYLLGRIKVKEIMSRTVITVCEVETIEYVAYKLYQHNVSALPVADVNNKLVGIISEKDIFRSFVEIMSMNRACTRITFDATDKVGVVADISHIFKEANVNIISIVSRQIDEATGRAEVVVRADMSKGGMEVVEILRQEGYDITDIMTYEGIV